MVNSKPGTVHEHSSGLMFVVLGPGRTNSFGGTGVRALILAGNPDFPDKYAPGSILDVMRDSGYWDNSRPVKL